jgi:hypothetical protein
MPRFVFRLLSFFLALGLGLFFGVSKLNVTDRSALPKQQNEQVEKLPEYYNFFSPSQTITPENGYSTKVPESRKTFCSDPKVRPIWNAIRRDRETREILDYTTESPDCRDMFEIKYVDLNRDGKKEILVRSTIVQFCGAVGNCAFWIFQRTGSRYRILFEGSDYIDRSKMGEQVLKTKTKGYYDILVKGHFTAAHTGFYYLKFDGRKYKDSKCQYEVPDYDSKKNLSRKLITCTQFYRDQGL